MRIVIVGGVAGGMSCAARMRRLDENADIIVLDKAPDVSIASCGLPYHIGGEIPNDADLRVQTPAKLAASLNLDVRTLHEVTSIDPDGRLVNVVHNGEESQIAYDALVLAPGAQAAKLPIPGGDSARIHYLRTVDDAVALKSAVAQATSSVVIGAGFIGVEVAENLREAGLNVTLVEGSDHILPPLDEEMATLVRRELVRLGIAVRENARLEAIIPGEGVTPDRLTFADGNDIDADLIVMSVGARADVSLAASAGVEVDGGAFVTDEHGRTNVDRIWAVGDAVNSIHAVTGVQRPVQLAGPANRAGRHVADDIWRVLGGGASDLRPLPKPLGTAIIRAGELQVAMTGASRRELDRLGIEYRTVHVHPNQHVTYFPGAEMMHMVVHFAADGTILGAQGVGRDGVDRRIDVLATAMRGGLKVGDLVDLDLAYAPPFGAAKDAVMMVGTAAQNSLDGMLALWYPWELEALRETHLILDVRSRGEAEAGPRVPGALVVPHTELRERMDEVRAAAAGRPIAVHCKSGVRSYLAHRVLAAEGLESASLSGGMLTLEAWADGKADVLEV